MRNHHASMMFKNLNNTFDVIAFMLLLCTFMSFVLFFVSQINQHLFKKCVWLILIYLYLLSVIETKRILDIFLFFENILVVWQLQCDYFYNMYVLKSAMANKDRK